jgi:integrase
MLRFGGIDPKVMPPPPGYEKSLPTVYEPNDAGALLRSTEGRLHLVLSVALMCGLREQELMHLQWSDINQRERTLRVRGKQEWAFRVKDSEQRDVPIPDALFEKLKTWHEEHREQALLFPAPSGKPDGHLLRGLKVAAREAGLNCGVCTGCKRKTETKRECREWTLHRFRRSYLTTLLRSNVDLRTAQAYAGHTDLASTMRYLRPASGVEARQKVNAIRWTD